MYKKKFAANPAGAGSLPPIPNLDGTIFDGGEIQGRDLDIAEYIELYYNDVVRVMNTSVEISVLGQRERSKVLKKLDQRFPGYPTDSVVFRVTDGHSDIVVAIPFNFMPGGFDKVNWFIVYNQVRQPVALVPLLTHTSMIELRKFVRAFCMYSCVFFVDEKLCYDDPDFNENFDWGWFPLTPDDKEDTNNG